jgi:hypothetical protein
VGRAVCSAKTFEKVFCHQSVWTSNGDRIRYNAAANNIPLVITVE